MFSTVPPLSHTPHHADHYSLPRLRTTGPWQETVFRKPTAAPDSVIPNLCLASCRLPNHVSSLFLGLLGLQLPVLLFPCLLFELQHSADGAEWQAEQRRSG